MNREEAWAAIHRERERLASRRPLGIVSPTPIPVFTEVASHFATRDFTVPSKSTIAGLELRATDGDFSAGVGPEILGPTLSLLMAMSGRVEHLNDLSGDGVALLRERITT